MAAVECNIEHGSEIGPDLGPFPVADSLNQQLTERLTLELEFAQHIEHLPTERLARLFKFFQELPVDITLAGFFGHEVPEMANLGLADTMYAAKALLQPVGIPR